MPHSSLPGSFDPFATHPFTNNSGLVPASPQPSQYLMPTPSRGARPAYHSQFSYPTSQSSSGASTPSSHPRTPMYSPRPQAAKPIFTPFQRSDTSSPELVLKKKGATYLVGK